MPRGFKPGLGHLVRAIDATLKLLDAAGINFEADLVNCFVGATRTIIAGSVTKTWSAIRAQPCRRELVGYSNSDIT